MATGLPIVATRVGGIPEIIEDGATGWLVEPESPSALAEAAIELISSPDLRSRLSTRAREAVQQRFTVQIQAQRYLRLYERLLASEILADDWGTDMITTPAWPFNETNIRSNVHWPIESNH